MRLVITVATLLMSSLLFGQEYSRYYDYPNTLYDAAWNSAYHEQRNQMILLGTHSVEDTTDTWISGSKNFVSVNSLNDSLSISDSIVYDDLPFSYRPFGPSAVFNDDNYFLLTKWSAGGDSIGWRMMKFNWEGELLLMKDTLMNQYNTYQFTFEWVNDHLFLSFYRRGEGNTNLHNYWLMDEDFNIVVKKEYDYIEDRLQHGAVSYKDGEYLYTRQTFDEYTFRNFTTVIRFDTLLDIIDEKEYYHDNRHLYYGAFHMPCDDGGFLMNVLVDSTASQQFDSMQSRPIILKLDSNDQIIKENVLLVPGSDMFFVDGFRTYDGNFLLTGESNYFLKFHDEYDLPYDRNCHFIALFNQEGDLLWSRYIIDNRYRTSQGAAEGYHLKDGRYFFNGTVSLINDDGSTGKQGMYAFTLDSMGCWNGNCEKAIIITSDSTSIGLDLDYSTVSTTSVGSKDEESTVFPNPTSSDIVFSYSGTSTNRIIKLINQEGKVIQTYEPRAPETNISLLGNPAGVYYLQHWVDGEMLEVKKVVLEP